MFNLFKSATPNTDLADALKNNPVLIDVRTTEEFAGGTAKNAINIPLSVLPVRMNEVPKDKTVVVFCQSGGRSAQATSLLQAAGYTNIIDGGGVSSVIQAQPAADTLGAACKRPV